MCACWIDVYISLPKRKVMWPYSGQFQVHIQFEVLDQIKNYLIWLVIVNHTNYEFIILKFRVDMQKL